MNDRLQYDPVISFQSSWIGLAIREVRAATGLYIVSDNRVSNDRAGYDIAESVKNVFSPTQSAQNVFSPVDAVVRINRTAQSSLDEVARTHAREGLLLDNQIKTSDVIRMSTHFYKVLDEKGAAAGYVKMHVLTAKHDTHPSQYVIPSATVNHLQDVIARAKLGSLVEPVYLTLSTNRSDGSEPAASLEAVIVDSVNSSNGIFSRN